MKTLRQRKGWIDGVCLTGGEPTLHSWLPVLIRDLKTTLGASRVDLQIKLDTNGSNPEFLKALIRERLVDYVAMDLKGPLDLKRYEALAGVPLSNAALTGIQESIQILLRGEVDYEFRTTIVPSLVTEEEIYALAERIRGAGRYTLQNFNPRDPLQSALRQQSPFEEGTLRRMQSRVNEIIRS